MQKGLFGSNLPWPLHIKSGDYCCLCHYEVGTLFALWQATCDGGKNLVPKAWGGRFPFQVKVAMISSAVISLPKTALEEAFINPETGKLHNHVEGTAADDLLRSLQTSRSS